MKIFSKAVLLVVMIVLIAFSEKEKSVPEKVASFYGVEDFEISKSVSFTFNVSKDGKTIKRKWKWVPKTNEVFSFNDEGFTSFIHNNTLEETDLTLDKKFVNDCYWLLFPYYLKWDEDNYQYTTQENVLSPINKVNATKLTIEYISENGFSPNDIYEFYLKDTYEIIEWVYRKGGSEIPTKITTWEANQSFENIKFSTLHQGDTGDFKVWFDDIVIEK